MKSKSGLFLAITLPLFTVLGLVLFLNQDDYRIAPWVTERPFEFPRAALADSEGNFVVSDKGDRRLTSVAIDGTQRWVLNGDSREAQGFYTAALIDADQQGRVWFVNSILDPSTNATVSIEVKNISSDGQISAPVWRRQIPLEDQVGLGRVPFMFNLVESEVFYFLGDGEATYAMHRINLQDGSDQEVLRFAGTNLYDYSSIVVRSESEVFFLDTLGQILQWDAAAQTTRAVFDNSGKEVLVPSWLVSDGTDGFLLLDAKRTIVSVSAQGAAQRLAGPPVNGWYLSSLFTPTNNKFVVPDEQSNGLWLVDLATGASRTGPAFARLSGGNLLLFWLSWALLGLEILLGLTIVVVLALWVRFKRSPLLIKQLIVFLPLILVSVSSISWWVYESMYQKLTSETESRLLAWSALGSRMMSGDDLARIDPTVEVQGIVVESPEFLRLTEAMAVVVGENADPWNTSVFDYVYYQRGNDWFVFDQYGYFERYLPREGFESILKGDTTRVLRYRDAFSSWMSGFTPIKASDGTVVGLFEVTLDAYLFDELRTNFFQGLLLFLIGAIVVVALVSGWFTWWLLNSIRSLSRSAVRVREGDYSVQVDIQSHDEIEDLGQAFNQMTEEIKGQIDKVIRLNQANAKFVPNQFLSFLGKESILDIRLGDQVQKEMTVLFSDIRSFTTLSERMSPTENFDFINAYLRQMGPLIRENQGFIDKYIGDAIMALFPGGPADALRAAVAMAKGLQGFNSSAGFGEIQIGIGIHTGNLMLGIVGEEMRYDGTVISDAVNLASRLESLTKYYGVAILVSGASLAEVGKDQGINSRFLDCVSVKGKSEPVMLYEIIAPTDPLRERKKTLQSQFQEAYDCYAAGRLTEAAALYNELARLCPGDAVPDIFLGRIHTLERQGLPADWNGVTMLAQK